MKIEDVFVDMDSTMNNFTDGYVSYFNKLYDTNYKIKMKDLIQYEISKCIPGINEQDAVLARSKILSTPRYWTDLPIYPNAADTMKWMHENFNVYILTAPWIEYKDCIREKYEWIEKHLPFFPLDKVIFCHDKHLIHKNSLLIDDHPKNLMRFRGMTMKYWYPFNDHTPSHYTAKNWKQVMKNMKQIKKRKLKSGNFTRF